MRHSKTCVASFFGVCCLLIGVNGALHAAEPTPVADYYTEPAFYESRPDPQREAHFGDVGVTGLKLRIYPGVVLKVEGTAPGAPADGKFRKGEVIVGVNGVALKGHNPYVAVGNALTKAEAKDGKLVFDVVSVDGKQTNQVAVMIPVLGEYSSTWPLKCKKSQAIIKDAAAFYSKSKDGGIEGALACLFLLSTGDDQYLPVVKAYFDPMAKNLKGIGEHTWNNGYNGIACGEYYLRTGDASVLPVMQYFCDDARNRQKYGIGWTHWGQGVSPGYVSGGLLNSAGIQVLTTLLLGKECGVNVDDKTLLGSLKFFYRFAGHGSVAYGDHRAEGWPGSANGKDGSLAAAMQIACDAKGNVDIYRKARDYYALATAGSAPVLVRGHGDDGRGDAFWRGLSTAYVLDFKPAAYHAAMKDLQWWYDLSRRASGALGVATITDRFDTEGSGAGVALGYTAPLKTLRITGAPRSKFAKEFTLPEHLWGRKADLAFMSLEKGKPYYRTGGDEPDYAPFFKFGGAYHPPAKGLETVPRAELVRNVYHWNYTVRSQSAKALMHDGAFRELETLLQDKDPRVRRAALDGMTDYNYWFVFGRNPIRTADVSPAMVASIRKMLADPKEALYVVDGALLALSRASARDIAESLPLIQPWTTCDEWWLREGAFFALATAAEDTAFAPQMLPIIGAIYLHEDRPQARECMSSRLAWLARKGKPDSESARQITAIFRRGADEGKIASGLGTDVGGHYVKEAVLACLDVDPANSMDVARIVKMRFAELKTDYLQGAVDALLSARLKLPEAIRQELTDLLYGDYRQEFIRRMNAGEPLLNTVLTLTNLKHPELGWHEIGKPASADRVWQFMSFEPQKKDFLPPYEGRRFRDVTLPAGLEKWTMPEFDAKAWLSGKAPIGKGVFKNGNKVIENKSEWGDGEFLLMRTTFEVESLEYDYFRVAVLAPSGFRVYLNGQGIHGYGWWNNTPMYSPKELGPNEIKQFRKGTNVLAVYVNAYYQKDVQVGQCDVRLEVLKKADLLGETQAK